VNTVFVVMEKSHMWGVRVSKVFADCKDAVTYRKEQVGPDEFYDFDSAYQYWVEEWEVVGQAH